MLRSFAKANAFKALLSRARAPGAVILNYHSVGDPMEQRIFPGNCVAPHEFARQMRFVRRHLVPMTLDSLIESLSRAEPMPRGACVVTFDDGYRGVNDEALPILERYDVPASVFLPTDWISTRAEKWEDRLAHAVIVAPAKSISIPRPESGVLTLTLATNEDRLSAAIALCRMAPVHSLDGPDAWVDAVVAACGAPPQRRLPLLSPAEVRTMSSGGLISFGSHSASHRSLASLSRAELVDDVRRSRDMVAHWSGRPCRHFAFPFGGPSNIHPDAPAVLKDLGFTCALTTIEGYASQGDDPFVLKRTLVHPDDIHDIFRLKALGALDEYRRHYAGMRRLIHGRT